MYLLELFGELLKIAGKEYFLNTRILEIGPKDGLDSKRLASCSPNELVMIDLPEKHEGNIEWIRELTCLNRYIEENLLYMSIQDYEALGKFRLVWCIGVLYHNAEQMRMLRKLYRLLDVGGYLVLESATLRLAKSLQQGSYVEIHYPETYRNTRTITHLPTTGAIKSWLRMVGFQEIHDSSCYRRYNKDLKDQRYACICKKNNEDESDTYYAKSDLNTKYRFGDST
jgi:2-polyprenyl-3-methyl-5-hydroxy-6-metoxy-1,4-benzoquinol methylase